jgi:hypothetical protein
VVPALTTQVEHPVIMVEQVIQPLFPSGYSSLLVSQQIVEEVR